MKNVPASSKIRFAFVFSLIILVALPACGIMPGASTAGNPTIDGRNPTLEEEPGSGPGSNSQANAEDSGDGVGSGYGGTGTEMAALARFSERYSRTIQSLQALTDRNLLTNRLKLSPEQAAEVQSLILSNVDQLLEMSTGAAAVPLTIVDSLPEGINARTLLSKEGDIQILRSFLAKSNDRQIFHVGAHEFFHKVLHNGAFINDDSPRTAFNFS